MSDQVPSEGTKGVVNQGLKTGEAQTTDNKYSMLCYQVQHLKVFVQKKQTNDLCLTGVDSETCSI